LLEDVGTFPLAEDLLLPAVLLSLDHEVLHAELLQGSPLALLLLGALAAVGPLGDGVVGAVVGVHLVHAFHSCRRLVLVFHWGAVRSSSFLCGDGWEIHRFPWWGTVYFCSTKSLQ
jgi:hypothetical protein